MTDLDPIRAPHWRVAGVCALLYVVCFVMTVVISGQPTVYEGRRASSIRSWRAI